MIESNLFSAFSLNNKIFRNRIILSPMCQYKANNGFIDEWHLQHYSRFAFSGLGGAFVSVSAISKELELGMVHWAKIEGITIKRTLSILLSPKRYHSTATQTFKEEILEMLVAPAPIKETLGGLGKVTQR